MAKKTKRKVGGIKIGKKLSKEIVGLLLKEGNMTQAKIAEKIGRSKTFISKVLNGKAEISIEDVTKLTTTLSKPVVEKVYGLLKKLLGKASNKAASTGKDLLKKTGKFLQDFGKYLESHA